VKIHAFLTSAALPPGKEASIPIRQDHSQSERDGKEKIPVLSSLLLYDLSMFGIIMIYIYIIVIIINAKVLHRLYQSPSLDMILS